MPLVVADTSPIRYLVEIRQIGILPHLFPRILVPEVVLGELRHAAAPEPVRLWAKSPPDWFEVLPVGETADPAFQSLDAGERSALILGMTLAADLILIDDRKGAAAALRKGFEVTGTLGLLTRASQRGLLDLANSLDQLKLTNFHYRQEVFDQLLRKYGARSHGQ
jgi:predicted nucleic acid-binding protein